ncbi:WIAG-tail domain, partial [Paenibacillus terreus]
KQGAVSWEHLASTLQDSLNLITDELDGSRIKAGTVSWEHLASTLQDSLNLITDELDGSRIKAGTVSWEHLASTLQDSLNLITDKLDGSRIKTGAVSWEHLDSDLKDSLITDEVDGSQIKSGALSWDHFNEELQVNLTPPEELDGSKLLPGSVEMFHLADEVQSSIQSLHEKVELLQQANEELSHQSAVIDSTNDFSDSLTIDEVTEQLQQPAITPIRCTEDQPPLQQFGRIPFLMHGNSDTTEVTITFDEPFSNPNYTLVAMTNHSAFYAVMKSQSSVSAVLEIAKLRRTDQNFGIISWIAIGID